MPVAQRGDADAKYLVGDFYVRGQGGRTSLVEAYFCYTLAARQGDEFTAGALDDLARRMSPNRWPRPRRWRTAGRPRPISTGGSLAASVFTDDSALASATVASLGPTHGRILVVDSTVGKNHTGHVIVMPQCVPALIDALDPEPGPTVM